MTFKRVKLYSEHILHHYPRKNLFGNPGGKRPLERPRRRWVDNIKTHLKEVCRSRETDDPRTGIRNRFLPNMNCLLKARWLPYAPRSLTSTDYTLCSQSAFVYFAGISERTAIISP